MPLYAFIPKTCFYLEPALLSSSTSTIGGTAPSAGKRARFGGALEERHRYRVAGIASESGHPPLQMRGKLQLQPGQRVGEHRSKEIGPALRMAQPDFLQRPVFVRRQNRQAHLRLAADIAEYLAVGQMRQVLQQQRVQPRRLDGNAAVQKIQQQGQIPVPQLDGPRA